MQRSLIERANELGQKLAARVFLSECRRSQRFLAPSREEWVGINLLVRDDEISNDWSLKKGAKDDGDRL